MILDVSLVPYCPCLSETSLVVAGLFSSGAVLVGAVLQTASWTVAQMIVGRVVAMV